MPSFIYPRTVSITRPGSQGGAGLQTGYLADQKASETPVVSGLDASIQLRREGTANPTGLPGDGKSPLWDVLIPLGQLAAGVVQDRDLVYDDLGRKFQVVADYWDSLGANFRVQRLEK